MKTFNYRTLNKVVGEFPTLKIFYEIFKGEWKEKLFRENEKFQKNYLDYMNGFTYLDSIFI